MTMPFARKMRTLPLRSTVTVFMLVVSLFVFDAESSRAAVGASPATVAAVASSVAALPAPSTAAIAASDQAAIQSEVNHAVATGGRSAVESLLALGDPVVASDLLADATVTTSVTTPIGTETTTSGLAVASDRKMSMRSMRLIRHRTAPLAHSAAVKCWGKESDRVEVGILGVTFAWRQIQENGWCSNGPGTESYLRYGNTQPGGWVATDYVAAAYCWNSVDAGWGHENNNTWIHMINHGVAGGSYPWGCASLQTVDATLRMDASGEYDYYNDWGF